MNIIKSRIANESYHHNVTQKTQIVICKAQSKAPVHYLVDKEGNIIQYIPEKFWVSHFNDVVDRSIIFVGLESYGPLLQVGDSFFPVVDTTKEGRTVPVRLKGNTARFGERITNDGTIAVKYIEDLSCCPFRGFKFFERYFDKQLLALGDLLEFICKKNNIPKTYTGDKFWHVNPYARLAIPGIYGETAYREDYSYPYLDKRIVDILKSIK